MSILVDSSTRLLVQGITGKEGMRSALECQAYGTSVLAGVTPGKGGENVEGIPVFNTVRDAKAAFPELNASLIVVPGKFAKDAALEAIQAGIPLLAILTEKIPTHDTAFILQSARTAGVRVVGPSCVGIISPGTAKVGSIASGGMDRVFAPGRIGILSKSGGMTSEIANILTKNGMGTSTAIGIGSDRLIGSPFKGLLELFKDDPGTDAVILFGEVGGIYEEEAAEYLRTNSFGKPVVALIAGEFAEHLPEFTVLGHAGAIASKGRGSARSKREALTNAGVHVADSVEALPGILKANL
jgi:succinyl-CoA synthetase alpha subunit